MSTPWYQFGITQQHGQNGELGVDVGTPFHTPVTDVFTGTVLDAGFHNWGGQVDIATKLPNGQTVIEQFLHLDTIAAGIKAGAQVFAGQLLGLSGGETQQQVNAGDFPGAQHPVQNVGGNLFSTGPHTEFGLYTGTPSASTALNPTGYLADGSVGVGGNGSSTPPSFWQAVWQDMLGFMLPQGQQAQQAAQATDAAASAAGNAAAAVSDIPHAIQAGVANAGLILLALVFVAFGVGLLLWPGQQKIEQGAATAAKVAEVAAA